MKVFRKLALVSAIATLPATGFAMQAMDDAALSGVTGQDGISIGLGLDQTMNILIDDTDGLAGADASLIPTAIDGSGGLFIMGNRIHATDAAGVHTGAADVTIDLDVGGNSTSGDGVLLVQIGLAAGTTIETGSIHVGQTTGAGIGDFGNEGSAILDSMQIRFASGLSLGVQLGEEAENFLNITSGNIGTLEINNFTLNDVATGGAIGVDQIAVSGLDLTGTTASLTDDGLSLTLGAGLNNVGIAMDRVTLNANAASGASYLGDVYISGLNMAGNTVTINGK